MSRTTNTTSIQQSGKRLKLVVNHLVTITAEYELDSGTPVEVEISVTASLPVCLLRWMLVGVWDSVVLRLWDE